MKWVQRTVLSKRVGLLRVFLKEFVYWKGHSPLLDCLPKYTYKGWNIARSDTPPHVETDAHHEEWEGTYKGVVLRRFALSAARKKV